MRMNIITCLCAQPSPGKCFELYAYDGRIITSNEIVAVIEDKNISCNNKRVDGNDHDECGCWAG